MKRVIAIASGKGGVGKSTCSVNLACALQQLGARVGLLDCDIYGPSIPLMMGVHEKPTISAEERLVPPWRHGVKVISIVLLDRRPAGDLARADDRKNNRPVFDGRRWGGLDFLLVDLPPGTGDAQLSLCQTVPRGRRRHRDHAAGGVVGVVRKGIAMFNKVNVPILGIVENMSYFTAPNGERVEIPATAAAGGSRAAKGSVPRRGADLHRNPRGR